MTFTPMSLKFKSMVEEGKTTEWILQRAQKTLLIVRIGQINSQLAKLNNERCMLEASLDTCIKDEHKKREVCSFIPKSCDVEPAICKQKQIKMFDILKKKLDKLVQHKSHIKTSPGSDCISKWVRNCSTWILSDSELKVPAKRINFVVTIPKSQ